MPKLKILQWYCTADIPRRKGKMIEDNKYLIRNNFGENTRTGSHRLTAGIRKFITEIYQLKVN